ncbi:MAG: phenylacetate-CoA oxygenase subunit PaaJ [Bdellovibrionales bacterium]|nr:phenylacetate-CoA oxygenase subunit PaaJ [Bdellovibrionales bacterium]
MDKEEIWKVLSTVTDPEIPVATIVGMGIVRDVEVSPEKVVVTITPTYTGCPAMEVMEQDIRSALKEAGVLSIEVKLVHAPAWTTDWMTEETKQELKKYGIAPPKKVSEFDPLVSIGKPEPVACPFCDSLETERKSQFGSTACKALHVCHHCNQPFEEFKPF